MNIKRAIGGTMDVDYDLILFTDVECRSTYQPPAKIGCLLRYELPPAEPPNTVDPRAPNPSDKIKTLVGGAGPFDIADLAKMREVNLYSGSGRPPQLRRDGNSLAYSDDIITKFETCANILIDQTDGTYAPDKFFSTSDLNAAIALVQGQWSPTGKNWAVSSPSASYFNAMGSFNTQDVLNIHNSIFSPSGYYDETVKPDQSTVTTT